MLLALAPILLLVLGLGVVVSADLVSSSPARSYRVSLFTIALGFVASVLSIMQEPPKVTPETSPSFLVSIDQVLAFDSISACFTALTLFLAFLAVGMSWDSFAEEQRSSGEYYSLLLTATLGAVLVAHCEELLTFFISFELLSIPLYMVVGFRRYDRCSAEAGLKYFLSGALSSALFLFGASWVFGACGTTKYELLRSGLLDEHLQPMLFGLMMILAAFAFKVAAAPFHMWAPDTYQGAPIPVAAFLSSVPKAAMVGASLRLFLAISEVLQVELLVLISGLSVLSVLIGNLVALTQRDLTRLAAYSGVAQIGYILIGLAAVLGAYGSHQFQLASWALGAMLFYLLVYTVTNIAFWLILLTVSRHRNSTELDAFNGLSTSSPFLAFALLICVFSLAGVPPLAGFVGKLYLFRAAFYLQPVMAFVGVVGSVLSLYYYFNILRRCYFLKPGANVEPITLAPTLTGLLTVLLLLTFVGGLFPQFAEAGLGLADLILRGQGGL